MRINKRRIIALIVIVTFTIIRQLRGIHYIDIIWLLECADIVLLAEMIGEFITFTKKIDALRNDQLFQESSEEMKKSLKYIKGLGIAMLVITLIIIVLQNLIDIYGVMA